METLTTIVFLAVGTFLVVLTKRRLSDIKLSSLQSGLLTPHLDAALGNGDTSAIVNLCHNYEDSSLGRIVKAVVLRADAVSGSDGLRSEALKLLIDQAAAREIDRFKRSLVTLLTIAVTSAPVGVIVGGLVANSAAHITEVSDALIYIAEGFFLSIIAFIANKYLSTKAETEVESVEDLCDHLHGLLLSRRPEAARVSAPHQ